MKLKPNTDINNNYLRMVNIMIFVKVLSKFQNVYKKVDFRIL